MTDVLEELRAELGTAGVDLTAVATRCRAAEERASHYAAWALRKEDEARNARAMSLLLLIAFLLALTVPWSEGYPLTLVYALLAAFVAGYLTGALARYREWRWAEQNRTGNDFRERHPLSP